MKCNPRFLQVHTVDRKERNPPSGLSPYQISTSIQTEGYLNSILTRTSGLKCGIIIKLTPWLFKTEFYWYTDIFADKASVSMRCIKSTKAIKKSMQKKKK